MNAETGEPIEAKIIYERLSDGTQVGITKSNPETGEYEIVLPVGEAYGFYAESDGYLPISENIDLTEVSDDNLNQARDLNLVPVDAVTAEGEGDDPVVTGGDPKDPKDPADTTDPGSGIAIVMNNVFFGFDSDEIQSASNSELSRITSFLSENAGVRIDIAGHTDSTGPEAYNLDLSQRRAQAVKDFIVSKGVAGNRIGVKYFGETAPITTNDSREGRRENRRVEFKITQD